MKIVEGIKKYIKAKIISKAVELIKKDPVKNVDKIFFLLRRISKGQFSEDKIDFIVDYYKKNNTTKEYVENILTTTDRKCLEKFFVNFISNAVWYGAAKRKKYMEKEDTKIPFVILISPSMRCNLSCGGCYAAKYDKNDDISFEEVDRIISEGRKLGIYFFVILGGEPFFVKYLLDIYQKYNDVLFVTFTNGTLFDEELADNLKKLGNVIPMFSLEGFKDETDSRRGEGTYDKVMYSMDLLKERGILFGVSSAVYRGNASVVSSDEFIDMLIEKGSKISWYFIYMPVGIEVNVDNMLLPEQRIQLGRSVRKMRYEKPYYAIDFFNDAPYVGGCISGKYYCHINSKEDVEPCIFAHFSCDNLKGKHLIDIFRSDFFKTLRSKQPYSNNLLRPCMMIDNPNKIREIVKETGAHPTDESAEKMISDAKFMKEIDELAENFKPVADKAWKEDFNETGNYKMSKG